MPDDRSIQPSLRLGSADDGTYQLPVYPFVEPMELHGERIRHPVAIVGGGLTGLALACELAVRGIRAVVLDEDDTVGVRGASSRGICYAQKTLEIFERFGIYQKVLEKGIQWSVGRTFTGDAEVYNFDLKAMQTHDASEQPPFINLQQFYIEWFMVDRLYDLGVVELRWKNSVKAIRPRGDYVELDVETPKGNYTCEASWVVDCSGSKSELREQLGVGATSQRAIDRWCISDIRFAKQPPTERWTWIEAPFNENRAVWQHLMGDQVWRLDYQMPPDCDPDIVSHPDTVRERLSRQFGPGVDFEIVWVGAYAYRSQCIDTFRHGRVFFAGDAAHVMSPFGARGGNSGIQDAENLAWKLAFVLQNRAPEKLLDSYDTERRYAARQNITITNRTRRFLSPSTKIERVFRDAVLSLAREHTFARGFVNTGRMSSPTWYVDSPLNVGAGGGRHVQNVAIGVPVPGESKLVGSDVITLMAQLDNLVVCFVGSGLLDPNVAAEAGKGLPKPRLTPSGVARLEALYPVKFVRVLRYVTPADYAGENGPFVFDRDGRLERQLGAGAMSVAIVRPDLHLAGTLDNPGDSAIERALRKLLGGSVRDGETKLKAA